DRLVVRLTILDLFRLLDLKRIHPDLEEKRQILLPKLLQTARQLAPGDLERLVANWACLVGLLKPRPRGDMRGPEIYAPEASELAEALVRLRLRSHAERVSSATRAVAPRATRLELTERDAADRVAERVAECARRRVLLPPQLLAVMPSLVRF